MLTRNITITRRFLSNEAKNVRYMQTIPISTTSIPPRIPFESKPKELKKHGLSFPTEQPVRRSRNSKFKEISITTDPEIQKKMRETKPEVKIETKPQVQTETKKRRTLRPRKALITLSSNAITHLKQLLDQPQPKLIRIGVRNRGCSGLTYNLEYVDQPGKFDESVEQDGVKVLIDSKALFSIVGSEMDWLDDKLSSRFIFKNPNSKGTCGCGESFMV